MLFSFTLSEASSRRSAPILLAAALHLPLAACGDVAGPPEERQPEPDLVFLSTRDGALDEMGRPMRDIYRISTDGTGAENLTRHPAFVYSDLSLSPDGSRMVFASSRSGCDVWVMDVDGSDPRQLTNRGTDREDGCNARTRWSPDGAHIAFTSNRDGELHVYLMDPDGGDVRKLTGEMEAAELTGVDVLGWSPAGEVVFQTSRYVDGEWIRRVYGADADGTGARPLFDPGDVTPAWSPDGTRVAFIRESDGVRRLHMMNADGTGERPLTGHAGHDRLPGHWGAPSTVGADYDPWSPDGAHLAFERDADGEWGIYLLDADGSNLRRLTTRPGDQFNGWSPDGEWIAFTRAVNTSSAAALTTDVFIIRADGTGLVNVPDSAARDSDALWVPGR